MKKFRKAGAWLLTGAMLVTTFAYASPGTAKAADPFIGSLTTVDNVTVDGCDRTYYPSGRWHLPL